MLLSREGVLETLQRLNRLTACGIGYKSYTEQYLDSCGIFKDAVIGVLAVIAKQERVRLSERTRAGSAVTWGEDWTAKAQGRRGGGRAATIHRTLSTHHWARAWHI